MGLTMPPTVGLHRVSLQFPLLNAPSRSLKNTLLAASTGGRVARGADSQVVISALDRVSLQLKYRDRVALVGHNGSGKSTLLRVLAGIYEPTSGDVMIRGRVAAIFDPSLGMDPESTGLENIMLRGLMSGMTRAQIEQQMDEICAFTGLGEFLDMPVRTYSAGMQARLAFAVSTSILPEILLLDEGIGAGDAAFFVQATRRLRAMVDSAGILVLASHSEDLLRQFCTTGVLLEQGRVVGEGPLEVVLDAYHKRTSQRFVRGEQ